MGYQITVKYHPKKPDGVLGFDQEVVETKNFKVGKKEEEVSPEQLAFVVLKQLSRRDVYVFDIEAYEFVKKQISIKETKNGIIIGNKRYSFDEVRDSSNLTIVEEGNPNQPPPLPAVQNNQPVVKATPFTVIREEYFDPEPAFARNPRLVAQYEQLGLTVGKKYKIIKEIKAGSETFKYKIINNTGGTVDVPIQNFSVTGPNIQLDESNMMKDNRPPEVELDYPGQQHYGQMPSLR